MAASDIVYAASTLVEMCAASDENDDYSGSAAGATGGGGAAAMEDSTGFTVATAGAAAPTRREAYNNAYDCLSMGPRGEEQLKRGTEMAIEQQKVSQWVVGKRMIEWMGGGFAVLLFVSMLTRESL